MPGPHVASLQCYAGPNSSLLDAFFYGKAFAETLNEKLGTALDDVLANIGKQDAERREALRCSPSAPHAVQCSVAEGTPSSPLLVFKMSCCCAARTVFCSVACLQATC